MPYLSIRWYTIFCRNIGIYYLLISPDCDSINLIFTRLIFLQYKCEYTVYRPSGVFDCAVCDHFPFALIQFKLFSNVVVCCDFIDQWRGCTVNIVFHLAETRVFICLHSTRITASNSSIFMLSICATYLLLCNFSSQCLNPKVLLPIISSDPHVCFFSSCPIF